MAKYNVDHICGHNQTHELFGPGKERDRKIAWLETTICTDCWKAEKKESSAPVTAELINNMFSGGTYLAVTSGDTYAIKDALKSAGCRWMEYQDNKDILGLNKSRKAWMIKVNLDNVEDTTEIIQKLFDAGVTRVDDTTNPLANALAVGIKKLQEVK